MELLALVLIGVVAILAVHTVREHRQPQVNAIQDANVITITRAELEELQGRAVAIFEFGYKSAMKGDEYQVSENGDIKIARSTGSSIEFWVYNPVNDEMPVLVESVQRRNIRRPANVIDATEPPPLDYEAYA